MRIRIIKWINLALIVAAIYAYQGFAEERAAQVEAYEEQKAEAKAAWTAVEQAQAEAEEAAEADQPADGTYTGTGIGFGGDIEVSVTFQGGKITDVEVVSAKDEDAEYMAMTDGLPEQIVETQSADLDTVTGATISSLGVLDAAQDAIDQANGQ